MISQLCATCGATYLLKVIEMSNARTLAIRRARLEDQGNKHDLYKWKNNPPLIYPVETFHPNKGYDPQSGTFVHIKPTVQWLTLASGSAVVEKGKQVGEGSGPPQASVPLKKRKCDCRGEPWKKGLVLQPYDHIFRTTTRHLLGSYCASHSHIAMCGQSGHQR